MTDISISDDRDSIQSPELSETSKIAANSQPFISSLTSGNLEAVCFSESLSTFADGDTTVGKYEVSIRFADHRLSVDECFLIEASSIAMIDGIPCGSAIKAYIAKSGDTLEQKHHEYVRMEKGLMERDTSITWQGDEYLLESSVTHNEDVKTNTRTYSSEEMKGVYPEGCTLLLQRLMAMKELPPEGIDLLTLNADMNICPVHYRPMGPRTDVIDGKELQVVGIERTLKSHGEQTVTWQLYFTKLGRLVSRTQVGSFVRMVLLTFPPTDVDEDDPKPVHVKQPLNWEDDLELQSNFTDRKDELVAEHSTYLRQNPDVHALVADFLQFLLFRRPENVLEASSEYFSAFLPKGGLGQCRPESLAAAASIDSSAKLSRPESLAAAASIDSAAKLSRSETPAAAASRDSTPEQ